MAIHGCIECSGCGKCPLCGNCGCPPVDGVVLDMRDVQITNLATENQRLRDEATEAWNRHHDKELEVKRLRELLAWNQYQPITELVTFSMCVGCKSERGKDCNPSCAVGLAVKEPRT